MRLRQDRDTLVSSSTPIVLLAIALAFVAVGVVGIVTAAFGEAGRALHGWPWAAALSVGVVVLIGGTLILSQLRAVRLVLDRATGRGVVTTRSLIGGSRVEFALGDVRGVELLRGKDGDGDATFRIRLWLADGRALPLHGNVLYGAEWAEQRATTIERFVRGDAS